MWACTYILRKFTSQILAEVGTEKSGQTFRRSYKVKKLCLSYITPEYIEELKDENIEPRLLSCSL